MGSILLTNHPPRSLTKAACHLRPHRPNRSLENGGGFYQSKYYLHLMLPRAVDTLDRNNGGQTPVIAVTPPATQDFEQRCPAGCKPNVLKKHTKSTPNLKSLMLNIGKVNASCGPVPDLPHPPTPSGSDISREGSALLPVLESPCSAIYFTVDPSWDPSKGDADVYLLPFSGATADINVPHHATMPCPRTKSGKRARSVKSVVKTDNETSFLFLK